MLEILNDLRHLYAQALRDTARSLKRGWAGFVAVPAYGILLMLMTPLVAPLGIVGGFILGFANAAAAGALLALVEQCVFQRRVALADIRDALGHYLWEVIGVGFVLWLPSLVLEQLGSATAMGPFVLVTFYVLAAVFLNPLPEIVYQVKGANSVEHLTESVRFVHQHWIEWFLPVAVVVAPILAAFGRAVSAGAAGVGIGFSSLLALPLLVSSALTRAAGIDDPSLQLVLAIVITSVTTFAMLVFRGHLFAALRGSTRRARAFRRRMGG
ncbi:MAG: hypothetical protein U0610_25335 [bacterium]